MFSLTQKAKGLVVKAEAFETGGSASGEVLSSDALADAGDKVAVGDAGEEQDADEEPTIPGATVEVLNEENFERVTQAATGATTGDWFVSEYLKALLLSRTSFNRAPPVKYRIGTENGLFFMIE